MTTRPMPAYRQAVARCLFTVLTTLTCAGVAAAAVLIPAPPAVLLLVIAVSVGFLALAATRSAESVAVVRDRWSRDRHHRRALGELRRELELLPETGHPLDL